MMNKIWSLSTFVCNWGNYELYSENWGATYTPGTYLLPHLRAKFGVWLMHRCDVYSSNYGNCSLIMVTVHGYADSVKKATVTKWMRKLWLMMMMIIVPIKLTGLFSYGVLDLGHVLFVESVLWRHWWRHNLVHRHSWNLQSLQYQNKACIKYNF